MTTNIRLGIAGITLVAAFGLIYVSTPSQAAQGEDDLPATVKKIAGLIKKGDSAGAKKLTNDTAKNVKMIDEISDLMHMYRPEDKGGLGIENNLKKVTAKTAEEQANMIRAMADLSVAKGWEKPVGKRTKAAWNGFNDQMRTAADALAKAKNDKDATKAATMVTNVCSRCHMVFKD